MNASRARIRRESQATVQLQHGLRTTDMPTPRPLARSVSSRMENPGAQITSSSAVSSMAIRHRKTKRTRADPPQPPRQSRARRRRSREAPSRRRLRRSTSGCPRPACRPRRRSAADSNPWLTALRTRCRTGSIMRSIRYLSISVCCPRSSSRTRPLSRDRSRRRTACAGRSRAPAPGARASPLHADPSAVAR